MCEFAKELRVVIIMVLLHTSKGGGGLQEEEIVQGRGKKGMRLGKYELGRTLGEGNFGKVKYARNLESGQPFAIKILEKNRILDLKITDQVTNPCFFLSVLYVPNIFRSFRSIPF